MSVCGASSMLSSFLHSLACRSPFPFWLRQRFCTICLDICAASCELVENLREQMNKRSQTVLLTHRKKKALSGACRSVSARSWRQTNNRNVNERYDTQHISVVPLTLAGSTVLLYRNLNEKPLAIPFTHITNISRSTCILSVMYENHRQTTWDERRDGRAKERKKYEKILLIFFAFMSMIAVLTTRWAANRVNTKTHSKVSSNTSHLCTLRCTRKTDSKKENEKYLWAF